MLQGYLLFTAKSRHNPSWSAEDTLLVSFIKLLGPIPTNMLDEGADSSKYFDNEGTCALPSHHTSPQLHSRSSSINILLGTGTMQPIGRLRNVRQLYPFSLEKKINVRRNADLSDDDVSQFAAFLSSTLKYRPAERPTAEAVSKAPWLQQVSQGN